MTTTVSRWMLQTGTIPLAFWILDRGGVKVMTHAVDLAMLVSGMFAFDGGHVAKDLCVRCKINPL